jgi:uncharacterized protein YprB with RNaseH-like and TPR domain
VVPVDVIPVTVLCIVSYIIRFRVRSVMVRFRVDLKRELEVLKKRAEGVYRTGVRMPEPQPKGPSGPLTELVPGMQCEAGGGRFYRVAVPAEAIWDDARQFHGEYLEALRSPFPPGAEALDGLKVLQESRPEDICYLDLETTGLSMAPLFLVGLMYSSGDDLVVDQLFARDYTEERAVLVHTEDTLKRFGVLVTFNGIRFDIPFLEERMVYAGLELARVPVHVDLLPVARRVLKKRTPNHKLQTLERYLCNRKRVGDVPGSEIPGVYHDYVRTQDAGDIAGVFHHNRLDLLTMLQLVTVFLSRSG